jgi:ribulose-phosphate 3-epimerase
MKFEILPSLLAADFGSLRQEILRAEDSGADALHLDIMDAHFVPNLSFGPDVVALAKKISPAFCRNVHLMMTRPDLYIEKFVSAGADVIQIHVEAHCDLHKELNRIREFGIKNSIVINPATKVETLFPYLDEVDAVLVMTVNPGYGGQKFMHECLSKVETLRKLKPELDIMVDGGCNGETIPLAAKSGANQFVAGSYLFAQRDMAKAVRDLRAKL